MSYSLAQLNTLGVPSIAQRLFVFENEQQLPQLLTYTQPPTSRFFILGGGSNVVLNEHLNLNVIYIQNKGFEFTTREKHVYLRAQAGEVWHDVVRESVALGYQGLENLSLIPGSVGAAPVQNIGAYGVELSDVFDSLEAVNLRTGERRLFNLNDCEFAYRHSFFKTSEGAAWLILSVTLKMLKKPEFKLNYAGLDSLKNQSNLTPQIVSDTVVAIRQSKIPDPRTEPNVGSFFKNPIVDKVEFERVFASYPNVVHWSLGENKYKVSAAWLIQQVGLKGVLQEGLGMSAQHALVLVNQQGQSGRAVYNYAAKVIDVVNDKFGISIEPEPQFIGF